MMVDETPVKAKQRYQVVKAASLEQLSEQINILIADNWSPLGDLGFVKGQYVQAMLKLAPMVKRTFE